jgi:hypothetical protein
MGLVKRLLLRFPVLVLQNSNASYIRAEQSSFKMTTAGQCAKKSAENYMQQLIHPNQAQD